MNDSIRETLLAPVYDVASVTPLKRASKLSQLLVNEVYLKREDLQPVHSFKIRGAYNKMAHLSQEELSRGVIAASAGNHAQGVALSAKHLNTSALIVMPRTTPDIKVNAVKSYGAEVELVGDNYSEAYDHCQKIIESTGRVFIHPFDDPLVIAGQGTIGREIIEQLPTADYVFVAVGGGGLLAGVAQYIKQLRPDVRIIGVEPSDSSAMHDSLKAGERVILPQVGIFADGVAVKQVGELTFNLAQQYVDEVITVSTDQICAAIKSVFEETRAIVEPAGAVSVAGLVHYAQSHQLTNQKLIGICSGANMSFERLQFVAERTLTGSKKEMLMAVTLPERPGALLGFCERIVNDYGITEFNYRMHKREEAHIFVGIHIGNENDRKQIIDKLDGHSYVFEDLSDDDLAKEHIRRMIGGPSSAVTDEQLYEINFPERSGALTDFLRALGGQWNISLFNYRAVGGDIGRVLIGFEAQNPKSLEAKLDKSGYEYKPVISKAARYFLSSQ